MNLSISTGTIEDALTVEAQIPEFNDIRTRENFAARLTNRTYLILVALDGDKPIAYKVGYKQSESEFYSWLGGVTPSYRRKGIAKLLLKKQEHWALKNGCSTISVKSMNQYSAMLQLLISSGYQICGYEDKGSLSQNKILFCKPLSKS